MKRNDAFTDKILDRLKYLKGIDAEKKDEVTFLKVENISFAILKDKKLLVRATDRAKSMLPWEEIVDYAGTSFLEVKEYGNRVVVKELCQAIIKDLEEI